MREYEIKSRARSIVDIPLRVHDWTQSYWIAYSTPVELVAEQAVAYVALDLGR